MRTLLKPSVPMFLIPRCTTSPATVLLVILGGLAYSTGFSTGALIAWEVGLLALFVVLIMTLPKDAQIGVCKLFTLISTIAMGAVIIGIAAQIADDAKSSPEPDPPTDPPLEGGAMRTPSDFMSTALSNATAGILGGSGSQVRTSSVPVMGCHEHTDPSSVGRPETARPSMCRLWRTCPSPPSTSLSSAPCSWPRPSCIPPSSLPSYMVRGVEPTLSSGLSLQWRGR